MSEPGPLSSLRARFERLSSAVDAGDVRTGADRDRLRSDIIALFRDTETTLAELGRFKEQIRDLVCRFKAIPAPATTPRVDHLGSTTYIDRGWNQIATGDYAAASATLRRALELAPGDTSAELLLGWALMRADAHDEALILLQHVLEREPSNDLARASIGYICLRKGIFGEAVDHLSRVLRSNGDRKATLYANFYMGLLYLERGMYGDAKNFFAHALEMGPNLTEAWWELGRACYLEGKAADASRAWRHGAEGGRFNIWGEMCSRALQGLHQGAEPSFA
jgi:tetratricopeptide (TPR) repeat protein